MIGVGDERENCGRQKNKEDLCSGKRKRESKEDKGGLLRQRLGELRWRVIQSPEDEAGQQCVLKRRFYYYSGIVRPTVEETTVTGRIVCYDLKRREHSTPSRAGGSTGVRT